MSEEKTEAPTAKKKKEARKEGQVPRTQELGAWSSLLVFALVLNLAAPRELDRLMTLFHGSFRLLEDPDPGKALAMLGEGLMHVLWVLVILGMGVMFFGVASALAQGGFYLATKSVQPKLKKLDPIQGAKRVFGTHALWEGAKTLVKSAVVALISFAAVRAVMPLLGGLVPAGATIDVAVSGISRLLLTVAVAGLLMGAADYAFQRRKVGKQVRMTKHEVKQEHKQTEGDPLIKSAIRSRQLAASRNRMMADVGSADVVLVNPTHVAVALRYDPEAGAPTVVAKGAGAVAARIRERADEAEVPLVRDVPLARALYGACKVGQEIPVELFAAVAQVLAFVISRRTRGQRGGTHETPRADEELPALRGRPGAAGAAHPGPSATTAAANHPSARPSLRGASPIHGRDGGVG